MMGFKGIVIAAAVAAASCSVGADDEVSEIVHNLRQAGYPDSEIEVLDDGTVRVGGDAEVSLQASREMVAVRGKEWRPGRDDQAKQYRTTNLVGASVDTICVNGAALTGTLSTSLNQAIDNYNGQNLRFQMVRTSGSTSGCDAVITANVVSGTGGSAGFPANGLPYGTINIGSGVASYGVAVARHVITHELGHCIGFRHTDYFDRSISCGSGGNEGGAGVGAIHIPNTPTGATFNGSVMNACYNFGSTGVWTSGDVTALHALYGVSMTTYHLFLSENCGDLFGRQCTSSFPSPQCPSAQEGAPCTSPPTTCWKVLSPNWVERYRCF